MSNMHSEIEYRALKISGPRSLEGEKGRGKGMIRVLEYRDARRRDRRGRPMTGFRDMHDILVFVTNRKVFYVYLYIMGLSETNALTSLSVLNINGIAGPKGHIFQVINLAPGLECELNETCNRLM